MCPKLASETFGHVRRAPGVVQRISRHATVIRRVEEHHVKALAGDWCEEVALAYVDVHIVQQCIDARAAHSRWIDVDRDYLTASFRGCYATCARAATEIQHS